MTLRARIWCDHRGLNPTAQKSSAAALAQMFEPIRDDLREVEREFARHVQSQVSLIPAIGTYIQDGGGYVGIHSAADTEYDWAFYGNLVGAYFKQHPAQQQATVATSSRRNIRTPIIASCRVLSGTP